MWSGLLSPLGPGFGVRFGKHGPEVKINALLCKSSQ